VRTLGRPGPAGPATARRGTGSSPFPYFAVRASLLCAGVVLIVVADARGALRLVAWCLIVAPLAGELVGSLLYLRTGPAGRRHDDQS
jgi:hypothetical protein